MTGTTTATAVVFRGWGNEADRVAKALTAAGIESELAETFVPAIIGGALLVCEVLVQQSDSAAAFRTVALIAGGRKHI